MTWHGRISIDDPSARLRDADGRPKRSSLLSLFLPFFFFSLPAKTTRECENTKGVFGVCSVFDHMPDGVSGCEGRG